MKTSLAPGSQVVSAYLDAAGLTKYLDALGFNTVGYGCTTCIGNSGPSGAIVDAIDSNDLLVSAVLGNRNLKPGQPTRSGELFNRHWLWPMHSPDRLPKY